MIVVVVSEVKLLWLIVFFSFTWAVYIYEWMDGMV